MRFPLVKNISSSSSNVWLFVVCCLLFPCDLPMVVVACLSVEQCRRKDQWHIQDSEWVNLIRSSFLCDIGWLPFRGEMVGVFWLLRKYALCCIRYLVRIKEKEKLSRLFISGVRWRTRERKKIGERKDKSGERRKKEEICHRSHPRFSLPKFFKPRTKQAPAF